MSAQHRYTPDENPLGPPKRAPRYWETSDFWKDGGERVVTMFLFSFAGYLTVEGFEFNKKTITAALIAAGLSTLKALAGARKQDTTTPVSIT